MALPSWSMARCWYPPPGKITTAVPFAVPAGGRYGVICGWSAGVAPSAPGALLAQSGIGGCARATSGRAPGVALAGAAAAVTGAGDDAVVAAALAHPCAATTRASDDTSECSRLCERVIGRGKRGDDSARRPDLRTDEQTMSHRGFTRSARRNHGGAEDCSPGRGAHSGASLLSIHNIQVFEGAVERSSRHLPRLLRPRRAWTVWRPSASSA